MALGGDRVGSEVGRLVQPGSRQSTELIFADLRRRILSGELEAGSALSQVPVARDYGISRGPVREAFRLLQRERLIEAEVNQRARVAPLSVEDIEQTYAMRVVNEALALGASVPRFTGAELDHLATTAAVVATADPQDFARWDQRHQRFHGLLSGYAGPVLRELIGVWADHTERYRRAYVADDESGWMDGAGEHATIASACRRRDTAEATGLLARHLARAGLRLISTIDPDHDPALLRAALQQVGVEG